MIELTPNTAFMIYLGLTLGMLFGIWCFQHFRTRKKKIAIAEKELFVCEYCHFCYLDDKAKEITKCSQCHSYNKSNVYTHRHHTKNNNSR
jgi:ribosomal protein L37AE/L43A